MADKHVRARCTTTGALASLPQRALRLGHIRNWVEVDGPAPKRSKSLWPIPRPIAVQTPAEEPDGADTVSAEHEEE